MRTNTILLALLAVLWVLPATLAAEAFDVLILDGTVYDGGGAAPYVADVAIRGDRIAGIGDDQDADAVVTIDATDLAVALGFINMLSWATDSLIADGRSQSDIRQGVTLEVFGEGLSYGPLNDTMSARR